MLFQQIHTQEQNSESCYDCAGGVYVLILKEYYQNNAQEGDNRSDIGNLECNKKTCDGGSDVGPEDNAGSSRKLHKPSVYKAYRHCGGCITALNDSGNEHTDQKPHGSILRQFFKYVLQFGTGKLLDAVAHEPDTVQE